MNYNLFLFSGILSLFAVFGSVLQFLAVYLDRSLQNSSNIFILSLGCSDFIVGIWTLPTMAVSVYFRSWVLSDSVCQFSAFVDSLAITASVWTLGFTALDRWMLVKSPISYKSQMKQRKAVQIVGMIWLISALAAAPPLLGWSGYDFSSYSLSCAMSSSGGFDSVHRYYFLFYVFLTFPAPIILIVISYSYIAWFVLDGGNSGRQVSIFNVRTAKITALLTAFVMGCILPTFIIGLIFWCGFEIPFSKATSKIVIWGLLANSGVNPLLYGWMNSQFRTVYKRMFWCLIVCKKYATLKRSAFSTQMMLTPTLRRSSAIRPVENKQAASLFGWTEHFDKSHLHPWRNPGYLHKYETKMLNIL